jgi:small subunit ribosomal protein S15
MGEINMSMSMSVEKVQEIVAKFGDNPKDTGNFKVQIALYTHRIEYLTEHFKTHKKDKHSRRGLLQLVSRRRKRLKYLKQTDVEGYKALISELNIRR